MLNLEKETIELGGKVESILQWGVVFITLEGAHSTLKEAKDSCNRTGQPYFSIMPMPIAKGETIFEITLIGGLPEMDLT